MRQTLLILSVISLALSQCPNDLYCTMCVSAVCTSCLDSFVSSTGVCTAPTTAVANCGIYLNATDCLSCNYGFFLKDAKTCTAISIANCLKLVDDKATTPKCSVCASGKKANADGTCSSNSCSQSDCAVCSTTTVASLTVDVCAICNSGFAWGLTTLKCEKETTANCGMQTGTTCSSCKPGF